MPVFSMVNHFRKTPILNYIEEEKEFQLVLNEIFVTVHWR